MSVRIDTLLQSPHQAVLKVSGCLVAGQADRLDTQIAQTLAQTGQVLFDLQGVTRLDYGAVAVLRRWLLLPADQPVRVRLSLRRGRPFLRILLDAHGIRVR